MDASLPVSRGLRWAGLLAWASAALPIVLAAVDRGFDLGSTIQLSPFALFAVAFVVTTKPAAPARLRAAGLGVQLLSAVFAALILPSIPTFVLTVVCATQLPFFFDLPGALVVVAVQTAVMATVYKRVVSTPELVVVVGIFAGFQLFGLFTAWLMEGERRARIALAATNAQLRVTHRLLADRVRRAERDRLAGDLHDLLGHDLVALRVNLEAAQRHEGDAARTHVEQAAALAGRMLGDVRDLARATRQSSPVDVAGALRDLATDVPRPQVEIVVDEELAVDDPDVAEAAVRCAQEALTNAMKHGDAAHLRIEVTRAAHRLVVTARDDGTGAGPDFTFGEGLNGLRRRAERLGGRLEAGNAPEGGFRVVLEVPVREEGA